MRKGYLITFLACLMATTAAAAQATVHLVRPGESIQAAIDAAAPGDTILVEPGVYQETGNTGFGLHITTDNLRLIGMGNSSDGAPGKVRLVQYGAQETGIYAAPDGCGPVLGVGGCADELQGFYVRGFTVEDFPRNGIQTRFVNNFEIISNESVRNLDKGFFLSISTNGLAQNNVSRDSQKSAMAVEASEKVKVMGNELSRSAIGLQITVSNHVTAKHNAIHDNTVGVGMFHPNAAGATQLAVMGDWKIEQNHIYDNNLSNPAPPGSFLAGLPAGAGVLLLGVSDNRIAGNTVENNDFVGIGVLGWCTATATGDPSRNCINSPPQADPATNNNSVLRNRMLDNGLNPPPGPLAGLAADITHFSLIEDSSGNCYRKNKPADFTFVSSETGGQLPTDGC